MSLKPYFLSLAMLTGCFAAHAQQNVAVAVQSNFFNPQNITISVGDTVTWTNTGGVHNVNGSQAVYPDNPVGFGSGPAANAPWTYSFVFNTPGSYDYRCDPHFSLGMTGTVTVEPVTTGLVLTGVFDGPLTGGLPKGIELYVLNDIADLSEYGVGSANNGGGSGGVEYTLPAGPAIAGSYLYLATEAAGFETFFGFPPDFVDDGNPSSVSINGDDAIELFRNGVVVDVFGDINVDGSGQSWEYTDGWAYRVNGTGPDGATFVPGNWLYSGIDVFDGAGQNANASIPMPVGTYEPGGSAMLLANNDVAFTDVNEPVTIDVLANDFLPNPVISLSAENGSNGTTSVQGGTVVVYTPNLDFCGSDSFTYEVCDAEGCETATVEVTVQCPLNYPAYSIAQVSTTDADGVADSLGVKCKLQGVVYGVDLQVNGLQFTLIDGNNDGIGAFNGSSEFGYTVQEGDEVAIQGEIGQFRGLTQINIESVELISTGNALFPPAIVNGLGEDTESQLVKLEAVELVDPAQWDSSVPSGFNVEVTNGTDTFTLRIHELVDLYNMPAPVGLFNVAGIGGQFDASSPYLEGYQLLPRYMEDIDIINSTISQELGAAVSIFPNPAGSQLTVQSREPLSLIRISTITGRAVLEIERPAGTETIGLAKLPKGAYLLTVVQDGRLWVERFIKL